MREPVVFLEIGRTYSTTGGAEYRCVSYGSKGPVLERAGDLYTLEAVNPHFDEDGLYWDHSNEQARPKEPAKLPWLKRPDSAVTLYYRERGPFDRHGARWGEPEDMRWRMSTQYSSESHLRGDMKPSWYCVQDVVDVYTEEALTERFGVRAEEIMEEAAGNDPLEGYIVRRRKLAEQAPEADAAGPMLQGP